MSPEEVEEMMEAYYEEERRWLASKESNEDAHEEREDQDNQTVTHAALTPEDTQPAAAE